jgi:hypothetical protein
MAACHACSIAPDSGGGALRIDGLGMARQTGDGRARARPCSCAGSNHAWCVAAAGMAGWAKEGM